MAHSNDLNFQVKPLVTIGVINYNNAKYVLEALNSVNEQTYQNIELVIVDDHSTDSSLSLIKEWLKSYNKPYQLVEHQSNFGIHEGYNSIIKNTNGEFLSIFATDDVLIPSKIEYQVQIFSNLTDDYAVVFGDLVEIDDQGKEIKKPNFFQKKLEISNWSVPQGYLFYRLITDFFFYIQTSLIRTSVLKKIKFTPDTKFLSEDWFIMLSLARNYFISGTDKVVAKYRIINSSISGQLLTNEKYHLWALDKAKMFLKVLTFEGNSDEEKKLIREKIINFLMIYAYHQNAKYSEMADILIKSVGSLLPNEIIKLFFYFNWFKIKQLISDK